MLSPYGPKIAAVSAAIRVISFNPILPSRKGLPGDRLAGNCFNPLYDAQIAVWVLDENHITCLRAVAPVCEAVKERALTREQRRIHAPAADPDAACESERQGRIETGNEGNDT